MFSIARHQVLEVVVGVGQRGILEERVQFADQVLLDVLALPHHHVAGQVVVAAGLGHFQHLLVLHARHRQPVGLDLDAGLLGEFRQQLEHRVVVRVRRDAHHHRLALVLGITVLRMAHQRQAGTQQTQGAAARRLNECASLHH
jgi:hypothetical protein